MSSTIATIHHGTPTRGLRIPGTLALVASLLVISGCYEGMDPDSEPSLGDADQEQEPEPDDGVLGGKPVCDPTMHVFPVADAHNIGWDETCKDYNCDTSCPDVHANPDWNGPAGHHGIDVFAYLGAPIVAVTNGVIADASWPTDTSGNRVRLRDDCGWEYYYGHLDSMVVKRDEYVAAGQIIGYMGSTGKHPDGSPYSVHLHFNVSPGEYSSDINPFDLLVATSPTACGGDVPEPEPEPEPEPQPEPPGDCSPVLWPGQALGIDESISSCNGRYTLVMQGDGNVVLYDTTTGVALWHSHTNGTAGQMVVMQDDGNFVLYDGNSNAVWHTGTHGHPGAAMRVEDDGNVIVWEGWTPIWRAL